MRAGSPRQHRFRLRRSRSTTPQAAKDPLLKRDVQAAAKHWYCADRDYPVRYEPSADDFLSPALVEALLMKRVLPEGEFESWLKEFLPEPGRLAEPPTVLDHADAKQSHLDGLCLSRAWCYGSSVTGSWPRSISQPAMPHVVGGDYSGEHWLRQLRGARAQRGSSEDPMRNSSTARAHCRPSRIAHTTSDWPRRMSPAAKTFGTLVA